MELKMFAVFLLIVVLFAGCGKKNNEIQGDNRKAEAGMEFGTEQKAETELDIGTDETEGEKGTGKEGTEPKPDEEPESPANYQRESESGKVKFDCKVETPDSFRKDNSVCLGYAMEIRRAYC